MLALVDLPAAHNVWANFQHVFGSFSFLQGNGYKPTPLDLTTIQLNEKMLELVDLLAENTHNVWAKDRIKHGWTYGLYEVCFNILKCFRLWIICLSKFEKNPLLKVLVAFMINPQERFFLHIG